MLSPSRFAALARLPGARLSFAPMWSSSLAIGYETDVAQNLTFRGNLAGKYSGAYNTGSDLHPSKRQPAFLLVNARVAVRISRRGLQQMTPARKNCRPWPAQLDPCDVRL